MRSRVTLEKRSRLLRYMEKFRRTIQSYIFKCGDLVLIRNSAIKDHLDRKMYERYLGPLVVVSRSSGGSYVLAELDGTIMDRKVAQFHVIPYYPRKKIKLPDNIHDFVDVSEKTLERLLDSNEPPGEEQHDYAFEGVRLKLNTDEQSATSEEDNGDNENNNVNKSIEEEDFDDKEERSRTMCLRSHEIK